MRGLRTTLRRVAAAFAVVVLVSWLTLAPSDPALWPPQGSERVRIGILDHGWHAGLALRQDDLGAAVVRLASDAPEAAEKLGWLASLYPDAEWIEVGWGDAAFYRVTPGVSDIDPWLGFRALAWPTPSVLQIVPGRGSVAASYPGSALMELELSPEGFERMAAALAESIPPHGRRPWVGPSLYGRGAFHPALPSYHLFRTCNHWTSSLLRAAGAPSSPLPSTFSAGLMAELRWRGM